MHPVNLVSLGTVSGLGNYKLCFSISQPNWEECVDIGVT